MALLLELIFYSKKREKCDVNEKARSQHILGQRPNGSHDQEMLVSAEQESPEG